MKRSGLLRTDGPNGTVIHFVDDAALLGSAAGCDIPIRSAAPNHCRILRSRDGYEVEDLTGQRLLQINGRRVAKALLIEGDKIEVGAETLTYSEAWTDENETASMAASVRRIARRKNPAPKSPA